MHKDTRGVGITISVASEILGVSPATLRNWDRTGKLRARRDANNSYRYYDIGELERFAETSGLTKKSFRKYKLSL